MPKAILVHLLVLLSSQSVLAQSPSFDYIDVGYKESEVVLLHPDGYELKASKEISDDFYLTGKYVDVSEDNYSSKSTSLGLGYRYNIWESASLFAELDVTKIKTDASSITSDINVRYSDINEYQFNIITGIRRKLSKNSELIFAAKFDGVLETHDSFIVGGNYSLNEQFKLYANLEYKSAFSKYSLELRYSLGLRYNF